MRSLANQNRKRNLPLRIRIGTPMLLFTLLMILAEPQRALPCFLAAAFHECGHILFARLMKIPLKDFKLDLLGAKINISDGLISYRAEFLLCAAGPLFSVGLGLLLLYSHRLPVSTEAHTLLSATGDSSFFLGVLNLLPVHGFDGSRMLSSVLSVLISDRFAEKADRFFTGFFLIFLWGISVYMMLINGNGLFLFTFSVMIFRKAYID
jgi:Zn-dependent protease